MRKSKTVEQRLQTVFVAVEDHSRVRGFVSHGGFNSLVEAARSAVPIVVVGFFGDQHLNGLLAQRNNWGKSVAKADVLVRSDALANALRQVLDEKRCVRQRDIKKNTVLLPDFSAINQMRWTSGYLKDAFAQ